MNNYIIGLGEALWDVLPEGKTLGGAPANFAYHAGQFGFDSIAISALGQDALGDEAIAALEAKGLRYIMPRTDYPTGTVAVTLSGEGIPSYTIHKGVAWDNIPCTNEMLATAQQALAICWGSLAQRSPVSRATIHSIIAATPASCLRVFDINLRQHYYDKTIIETSLRLANVLKINDEELVTVSRLFDLAATTPEAQCQHLLATYGLRLVVLTCGVNGSYVFAPEATSYRETPRVAVADTVGAGDSFTATFCAAILRGKSIEEAHALAVDVSAYVCTQHGAMPMLPENYKAQVKHGVPSV